MVSAGQKILWAILVGNSFIGTGVLAPAGLSLFVWGIGISPVIAAQQARLVEADPLTAPTSIALNTSIVYLGQAAGTFLGGQPRLAGFLAVALLALASALGIPIVSLIGAMSACICKKTDSSCNRVGLA